jgi:hypothetical protein
LRDSFSPHLITIFLKPQFVKQFTYIGKGLFKLGFVLGRERILTLDKLLLQSTIHLEKSRNALERGIHSSRKGLTNHNNLMAEPPATT